MVRKATKDTNCKHSMSPEKHVYGCIPYCLCLIIHTDYRYVSQIFTLSVIVDHVTMVSSYKYAFTLIL